MNHSSSSDIDPQPFASSYPSRRAALATAKRRSFEEPWVVIELLRHKGWHTAISSRLLADPAVATTEPYRTVAVFAQGRQV